MFLLFVPALAWLLYKWATDNHDYFIKLGVPFEKPLPLIGNLLSMVLQKESLAELMQRNYNKFRSSK